MSERDDLKARAEKLELKFAPNLSTENLKKLVEDAEAAKAAADKGDGNGQDDSQPKSDASDAPPENDQGTVTLPANDDGINSFEEALALAAASQENGEQPAGTDTPEPAFHRRKFLRVLGPAKGFYRAGRHFGPKPVDIPLDELSEDEARAITTETRLITTYYVQGVDGVPEYDPADE